MATAACVMVSRRLASASGCQGCTPLQLENKVPVLAVSGAHIKQDLEAMVAGAVWVAFCFIPQYRAETGKGVSI